MPRIPYRRDDDPGIGELVAAIKSRRKGRLINLDRMLLHSPPFAKGWNALLGAVRRDLELPPRVRELAICAVARLNKADYEWDHHAPEFLAAGGPQVELDALDDVDAAVRNERLLDEPSRAALAVTLELTRDMAVSDATLAQARKIFGDRQLVELVGTIATYNMVSRFLVALGVDEKGE
jgi:alkylhydroperoxidase family enzyme